MNRPDPFRLRGPSGGEGGGIPCARCGAEHSRGELDRMLWCPECIESTRVDAGRRARWVAAGITLLFTGWLLLRVRPGGGLLPAWLGVAAATWWLSARLATEVLYGMVRARPQGSGPASTRPPE